MEIWIIFPMGDGDWTEQMYGFSEVLQYLNPSNIYSSLNENQDCEWYNLGVGSVWFNKIFAGHFPPLCSACNGELLSGLCAPLAVVPVHSTLLYSEHTAAVAAEIINKNRPR